MKEWLARVRQSKPILGDKSAAEIIREMRDERANQVAGCLTERSTIDL
jgi:hypothetical protein